MTLEGEPLLQPISGTLDGAPVLALDTRQGILMLLATHGLGVPSSR